MEGATIVALRFDDYAIGFERTSPARHDSTTSTPRVRGAAATLIKFERRTDRHTSAHLPSVGECERLARFMFRRMKRTECLISPTLQPPRAHPTARTKADSGQQRFADVERGCRSFKEQYAPALLLQRGAAVLPRGRTDDHDIGVTIIHRRRRGRRVSSLGADGVLQAWRGGVSIELARMTRIRTFCAVSTL